MSSLRTLAFPDRTSVVAEGSRLPSQPLPSSSASTYKLRVAREMYRSGQYTVAAIAKTLGVSRASIYRHLTCGDA